ncbi:MAG: hypothetical protein AAFU79_00955 [Myxococcota bacterium]
MFARVSALVLSLVLAGGALAASDASRAEAAPRSRKATRIHFEVTPPAVAIFLDGRRLGLAREVEAVRVKPGRRVVRLVRDGDETEVELAVTRGRTVRFAFDFGE